MAYAQIFMEKLKQLIHCNDIPLFNDPSVTRERPQFHFLYKELGSLIQTLFNDEDRDLENFEKVRILQKRFKAAAEEAEDIVDIFLSTVHFRNSGYFPRSDVFHPSLHLEVVKRSIDSIKMECTTMSIQNMKMDSSQRADRLQIQSAGTSDGTSDTRNSLRSKKVSEEIIVGRDRDIELIRDKLVEDQEGLDVVSIVGMGGIGKTTLATKVFSDPFVVHHFYIRAWVTVSQTYERRDLLLQILSSMGVQQDLEKENESRLSYKLNKLLYQKRYLIVIDDIWSIDAWDQLKLIFKDHQCGSRILITSRLTEVASHVKQDGFIHQLQQLTKEQSWELLCGKVFQGDECPEWLFEPGMQIAENCRGLPLSLVVIAGVLANETRSKDWWEKFACSVRSYITGGQMGCLETLALSYHHLPLYLKECLLYLGGFQEDSWMHVERLIWFWMAEGFIQEDGIRSLQEIAESYVMDLVDRNLLIVGEWKFNGDVKVCKVHDLVRELCMEKAKEERFFLRIDGSSPFDLQDRGLKTLVLSFHRLPESVKLCFVYLRRFRENDWIFVQNLIALWIYEGYIEEDEDRSLEEIAEGYLTDLVQKNLLKVGTSDHVYNDDDRVCKVPDLAWKLFDGKEMEERLRSPRKDQSPAEVITTYKQRRLFTNHEINIVNSARPPTPSIRSFTCFDRKTTLIYDVAQYFHSFALLRVLNLPGCRLMEFPPGIALLVHLRYLSIGHSYFPSPICNLWSLQTLIIRTTYSCMVLPSNISNLVNLKHLWSDTELYLPSINKPMNLDSISHVMLGDGVENFQECFPIIKKLACTLDTDTENDFESLRYLQTLKLTWSGSRRTESTQSDSLRAEPNCGNNHIRFPTTLKKLTLVRCHLSWSDMTIIQSLPNLEALKLKDNAFEGILWETGEEQFQQLKFLKLENLNIKQWEASSTNFPCLKRLLVIQCNDLEAVPPEIGDIPTLEFIKVFSQTFSLFKSLKIIQQEQKDAGNFELKINHNGRCLSSDSTKHDETCSFYESDEG